MNEVITLNTANQTDRIALRGVKVRSRLIGMCQRTTIEQTFVNLEDTPIEAVYTFPLHNDAAVCGFEVITGDRVLTGAIEESEKALEKYDQAIERGHGAFLAEQGRPDVFSVYVGNLKSKQAVTIRLDYIARLEREDKSFRLAIPTTISPRYVTATGVDPLDALIDGDLLNPPRAFAVPYGLALEVDVELGREITGIHSPTHAIKVEKIEKSFSRVTLKAGITEMNRDIVVLIDLAHEAEPHVQMSTGRKGETFMAMTFVPEFSEADLVEHVASETTFVLDCSGSMQGESMAQAVAVLELCLRSLSPGDAFNICRFGSTFEMMSSEPLVYSQSTLDLALDYCRAHADLGGTELHAPLQTIFQTPVSIGNFRQIILLTDGQISNTEAVIALAAAHQARNRIFSFGIGNGCSRHLVTGLARATRGAAEFITEGEAMEPKVLRTFSRLGSPHLSEVKLDCGDVKVELAGEIPPVFDGDVLLILARVQGRAPARVELSGRLAARTVRWELATTHDPVVQNPDEDLLSTLWAREKIRALEVELGTASRHRAEKETTLSQQLIDLSKEFNLLSSRTSFIAIEHRSLEERTLGRPELRRVPIALTRGWGGTDAFLDGATMDRMAAPMGSLLSPPSPSRAKPSVSADYSRRMRSGMQSLSEAAGLASIAAALNTLRGSGSPASPRQKPAPATPRRDRIATLLSLQSAEGWFEGTDSPALLKEAGVEVNLHAGELDTIMKAAAKSEQVRLSQTLATLILLAGQYTSRHDEWRRAEQKAVRWIARVTQLPSAKVDSVLKALQAAR